MMSTVQSEREQMVLGQESAAAWRVRGKPTLAAGCSAAVTKMTASSVLAALGRQAKPAM